MKWLIPLITYIPYLPSQGLWETGSEKDVTGFYWATWKLICFPWRKINVPFWPCSGFAWHRSCTGCIVFQVCHNELASFKVNICFSFFRNNNQLYSLYSCSDSGCEPVYPAWKRPLKEWFKLRCTAGSSNNTWRSRRKKNSFLYLLLKKVVLQSHCVPVLNSHSPGSRPRLHFSHECFIF